jgi:hypothetical protein
LPPLNPTTPPLPIALALNAHIRAAEKSARNSPLSPRALQKTPNLPETKQKTAIIMFYLPKNP